MASALRKCPACAVERVEASFVGEVCNFCHDAGRAPPTPEEIESADRVRRGLRRRKEAPTQAPPEPAAPALTPAQSDARPESAYIPPQFDTSAAKASPQAELASRTLSRRRLLPFIKRFRPKYEAGWVHEDICRRLERFVEDVAAGREPRLLLMMPPRSGKSEIASRHFPPWVLGQHPDWEIIAASHTTSLSMSFSRYIRDLLRDPAYRAVFPNATLDPQSQSTENWNLTAGGGYLAAGVGSAITGRGAHCFPAGTLIRVGAECVRIEHLVPKQKVLSYDHTTDALRHCAVEAIQATARDDLYEIVTAGGRRVVATGDHPFYVPGAGYTEARLLGRGSPLLVAAMPALRRKESDNVEDVSGVLLRRAGGDRPAAVRAVFGSIRQALVRAREIATARAQGLLLFGGVQPGASRSEECEEVRELPATRGGEGPLSQRDLLLPGMPPSSVGQAAVDLPAVRRLLSSAQRPAHLLLAGVLKRIALRAHAWRGELPLQGRPELRPVVLAGSAAGAEPGRNLRRLSVGETPDSPSHQSPARGQPSGEPRGSMQDLPCGAPQVARDTVSVVRRLHGKSVPVYDLQVAGTSNFFAGEILVHNCLILDDLVKDIEAADSAGQRESTWEWYISTAHSRLAPGGGVLGIMCMTGDTPVLMADGTQHRLDTLTVSDTVATYDGGRLRAAAVKGFKSNGRDSVLKITTSSGKIVRANQRHPFLATTITGELKWIRARSLSTANKIVTVKGSGGSGKALSAGRTDVISKPFVGGCAPSITAGSAGSTGIDRPATATNRVATPGSSIATGLLPPITTLCTLLKAGAARFAASLLKPVTRRRTGQTSSPSIIATTQGRYEACYATTATQESDILELSPWHLPRPGTSDFILDDIVSIEPDGIEEVFDVQVERTENFIANGLVSHNTWWHEDDWAGRIQQVMKKHDDDEEGGEVFEIVRYPAINEHGDEYILADDSIAEIPPGAPVPEGAVMTRPRNTALHPARYSTAAVLRKKANYIAAGMKRMWDALYQQNPTPDEGIYFGKNMFRYYVHQPATHGRFIYQAWDFAITTGEQNDWTVGTTLLQDEYDNLYVLDVLRFRTDDGIELVESILDYQQQWGAQLLGFEDGQIWKALASQFKKRCEERQIYPSYELLVPLTDKMVRASPLRGRMQLGKVYFPSNASWFSTLQTELLRFPGGKHDDQVDSLAWCVRLTLSRAAPKLPQPRALPSWKDKLKKLDTRGGGAMAA